MMETNTTKREKRQAVRKLFLSVYFRFFLIGAFVCLSFGLALEVSSVSTRGYDIAEKEKKIDELEKANRRLDYAIAKNRSMESIQDRLKKTDMILASNRVFLEPKASGNSMARR